MPVRPTKGTRQTNLELPTDVIDQAKEFAKSRNETLSEVVVAALKRHMANPPPLPEQIPLPPVTSSMPVVGAKESADVKPKPTKKSQHKKK